MVGNIFKVLLLTSVLLPAYSFADNKPSAEKEIRRAVQGDSRIEPFGQSLFSGQFNTDKHDGLNPNYVIISGDNITVAIWGALEMNQTIQVDAQGNIFIPNIGPVKVAGVTYEELNKTVRRQVNKVYKDDIDVYTNLQGTRPVSVFVTGGVNKPGRFNGVSSDTVLHYVDSAEGIDQKNGSYRNISIKRDGKVIEKIDIYEFLLEGAVPKTQLKDNDVIFVNTRGIQVIADGEISRSNVFEFDKKDVLGSDLLKLAEPGTAVTNVSVSGVRDKEPFSKYYNIDEFKKAKLFDGDSASFISSKQSKDVKLFIEGTHEGPNVIIAPKNATLLEVLSQIKINPESSDFKSVYIERKSVAEKQKAALDEALKRLQENVLLTPSVSKEDAGTRSADAAMVEKFIEKAKNVKPKGRVVVSSNEQISEIKLEDGDRIVIPETTNIVSVNGEVTMPNAMVYNPRNSYKDYINQAGGFTDRAAKSKVFVIKASGETRPASSTKITEGDEIVVLPEVKFQDMQLTKDVADIIYKLVLAVAIPVKLFENN